MTESDLPHDTNSIPSPTVSSRTRQVAERALGTGKSIFTLLRETLKAWNRDNARQLGAALAFYTALSFAPLIVLLIVVAGQLFGSVAARNEIQTTMQSVVGSSAAGVIQTIIQNASTSDSSLLATLISFVTLMFSASRVFGQLRKALNMVWGLAQKPGRGLWGTIRNYLISFLMMLAAGSLLIAVLALDTVSGLINEAFGPYINAIPNLTRTLQVLRTLQTTKLFFSFGVFSLIFGFVYKTVPDAHIDWRDALIGGAFTSLLLTLGNTLVGFYLRSSSVGSAYGAAGSLIALLVWVYYSAQGLFLGAEFTKVYANTYGSRIIPDTDALHVVHQQRSRQEISDLMRPRFTPPEPQDQPPTPAAQPEAQSPPSAQEQTDRSAKAARYGGLAAAVLSIVVGGVITYRRLKGDR